MSAIVQQAHHHPFEGHPFQRYHHTGIRFNTKLWWRGTWELLWTAVRILRWGPTEGHPCCARRLEFKGREWILVKVGAACMRSTAMQGQTREVWNVWNSPVTMTWRSWTHLDHTKLPGYGHGTASMENTDRWTLSSNKTEDHLGLHYRLTRLKSKIDALPGHLNIPYMPAKNINSHNWFRKEDREHRNQMLSKTLQNCIQRSYHYWEVQNRIGQAIEPSKDRLTMVIKRKLKWYDHKTRSAGPAKTLLQSAVQRRRRKVEGWRDGKTTSLSGKDQSWAMPRSDTKERYGWQFINGAPAVSKITGLVMMMTMMMTTTTTTTFPSPVTKTDYCDLACVTRSINETAGQR